MRLFKYSYISDCTLAQNPHFIFSKQYALQHYDSKSIITFIPKNGCTSLRASLALANGMIPSLEFINWIHNNNNTMEASLFDLQTASYTAIILRCPYRRIASAFLDKFGTNQPNAYFFMNHLGIGQDAIESFSFIDFVRALQFEDNLYFDPHWVPQISYLVYHKYDEYLDLADSKTITTAFAKNCGFVFEDTRNITKNGINHLNQVGGFSDHANTPWISINKMRHENAVPAYSSLFNDEALEIFTLLYAQDIDLFEDKFGSDKLLFPTTVTTQSIAPS